MTKIRRMATSKEYNLIEAIEAVASQVSPALDIVTVKIAGPAKTPIVRVYIDHPDGVGFDILCETQKWVGDILDEINPFNGSYTLEVSSPGPDRPLRKLDHFKAAIDKKAKIKASEPVDGRKAFTGFIVSADENIIEIALDEGKKGEEPHVKIPFAQISDANLIGDMDW